MTDQDLIHYLNFLRASELLGVQYLLRLSRLVRDPVILSAIHRHLAEEANHARIWANTIESLGGAVCHHGAFQPFMVEEIPRPRSVIDVLALNVTTEKRAMRAYQRHAAQPGNPWRVQRSLEHLIRDEEWHIEWQQDWLAELAGSRGVTLEEALDRYRPYDARASRRAFQAVAAPLFPEEELERICGPT